MVQIILAMFVKDRTAAGQCKEKFSEEAAFDT